MKFVMNGRSVIKNALVSLNIRNDWQIFLDKKKEPMTNH